MALNTQMSNAAVNAEASAFATLCNNGYLRIYNGTQPANADTALGSQVLLAELRMGATAFGAPSAGVITANAITSGTGAAADTATWFRLLQSNGTTVLLDGTVGTSNSNMVIGSTSISVNQTVSCSGFTHTISKATAGA